MGRWFRLDEDIINDPKVLALSEATRWHWLALLCVASKNGGQIPSLHHAAVGLRLPEKRAALIVAKLASSGLLDRVDGGYFEPHNWGGRQYQTDARDPTNAERQQRYRDKHRNDRNVTPAVTAKRPDTEVQKQKIDDGDDASARGGAISPEAFALADEVAKLSGIGKPLDWPPGWCGAPMRVQSWINQGWQPEAILAAVRGAMARKRDGPPGSVQYFERAIAKQIAEQSAPLPTVVHLPAQTVEIRPDATHRPDNFASGLAALRSAEERLRASAVSERGEDAPGQLPARAGG